MREFARRCGFSATQISKYESGEADPSATSLRVMADQLEVSADYLIGRTNTIKGHFGEDQLTPNEAEIVETYRREGWTGVIRLGTTYLVEKT